MHTSSASKNLSVCETPAVNPPIAGDDINFIASSDEIAEFVLIEDEVNVAPGSSAIRSISSMLRNADHHPYLR